MARDIQEKLGQVQHRTEQFLASDSGRRLVGTAVSELLGLITNRSRTSAPGSGRDSNGALSGARGVAVGAGAAALAPMAVREAGRLIRRTGVRAVTAAPRRLAKDGVSKFAETLGRTGSRKPSRGTSQRGQGSQARRGGTRKTGTRSGGSTSKAATSSRRRAATAASGNGSRSSSARGSRSSGARSTASSGRGRSSASSQRGGSGKSSNSRSSGAGHEGRARTGTSRRS